MEEKRKQSGGCAPFLGWLTLPFVVLKLVGCIGWSWWWVLSPIWIPIALTVLVVFLAYLLVILKVF
jgi:hypothetical protein